MPPTILFFFLFNLLLNCNHYRFKDVALGNNSGNAGDISSLPRWHALAINKDIEGPDSLKHILVVLLLGFQSMNNGPGGFDLIVLMLGQQFVQ